MPLFIETLDDPLLEEESPEFSAGVNSFSPPESIAVNGLAKLVNADISIEGRAITRRGSASIGTNSSFTHPFLGLGYWSTEAAGTYQNNLLAVVRDTSAFGRFKIWDGTNWQNPPSTLDWSPTLPVYMVMLENLMWIAQEGSFLAYFNGTGLVVAPHSGNVEAPVKPSIICSHTERLVAAGIPGDPEGLSFSNFFVGSAWNHTTQDIGVGDGDGDPIVGIVSWTNFNLVVLKRNSLWMVTCTPTLAVADFSVTKVHDQIGTVAGRSAAQVGKDVFFLSDSGVRSVARTLASDDQTELGPPVSQPITDIINRINPAAYGTIVAKGWQDRYFLALPLDSATQPNFVVVWDDVTKSWSGYWTGWQPTCFSRRMVSSVSRLCFGQADGTISDFLDYIDEDSETDVVYQDRGVNYATEIVGRAFYMGNKNALKTGSHAPMVFNRSSASVTVSAIVDSADNAIDLQTFDTTAGTTSLPIDLPFDLAAGGIAFKSIPLRKLGQWRHLQLKISSTAGKISLNRFGIAGWMDTHRIQV